MDGELKGTRASVRRFIADLQEAHEGALDEPIWLSSFLGCFQRGSECPDCAAMRVRPWSQDRHPQGILHASLQQPIEVTLPGDRVLMLPKFIGCSYKIVAAGHHAAARLGFEPGQALRLLGSNSDIVMAILLDPYELDLVCVDHVLAYKPTEPSS